MTNMTRTRWALTLILLTSAAASPAETQAAEPQPRPAQIRVHTPEGDTWLATGLHHFVRFGSKPSGAYAIYLHEQEGGIFRVDLFRAVASSAPGSLPAANYKLVDTFNLPANASAVRQLSPDIRIDVAIPVGGVREIEISEDDTAGCCVYCDNGVEICGTKVRSSCGNCG